MCVDDGLWPIPTMRWWPGRILLVVYSWFLSGYLVVVWCFVVDSVAHESGVAGGARLVPVPDGFAFHGWALDEGALSLLGDF